MRSAANRTRAVSKTAMESAQPSSAAVLATGRDSASKTAAVPRHRRPSVLPVHRHFSIFREDSTIPTDRPVLTMRRCLCACAGGIDRRQHAAALGASSRNWRVLPQLVLGKSQGRARASERQCDLQRTPIILAVVGEAAEQLGANHHVLAGEDVNARGDVEAGLVQLGAGRERGDVCRCGCKATGHGRGAAADELGDAQTELRADQQAVVRFDLGRDVDGRLQVDVGGVLAAYG